MVRLSKKKGFMAAATQYRRQQGINPIFYLIIYLKLVVSKGKNIRLMRYFAKLLPTLEDFCSFRFP